MKNPGGTVVNVAIVVPADAGVRVLLSTVRRTFPSEVTMWNVGWPVVRRTGVILTCLSVHAFPTDKGFRSLEGVFHPLTGCFYSIAGGFEVDPIVACRELEVAILRPVVDPDEVPRSMVDGGPKIVDNTHQPRRDRARNGRCEKLAICKGFLHAFDLPKLHKQPGVPVMLNSVVPGRTSIRDYDFGPRN
jgi:hypothetical protein